MSNVQLFGGFDPNAGIRTLDDARYLPNLGKVGTILQGVAPNNSPTYHVVISAGDVKQASMDGFTVTGGRADGISIIAGRWYTKDSISVNNQWIFPNMGGNIYLHTSSPALRNMVVESDWAQSGGGMHTYASYSKMSNLVFRRNSGIYGAGMQNLYSAPVLLGAGK